MNCPEERRVRLATFLLQKEAKGWWKPILARRNDARTLDWQTFRGQMIFRKPGFTEVVFSGLRKVVPRSLNSVLKAEKLLRKGKLSPRYIRSYQIT